MLENPNPTLRKCSALPSSEEAAASRMIADLDLLDTFDDSLTTEPNDFSVEEIFGYIRDLRDPEHPYTLESLGVVMEEGVTVTRQKHVTVRFTPTIPHCSQATLIGLMIRVKLMRSLPDRFKIRVHITQGTHNNEEAVNKQLADKERVAAALENPALQRVIDNGIAKTDSWRSIIDAL